MSKSRYNPILVERARSELDKMRYEMTLEIKQDWDELAPVQKINIGRNMSKRLFEKGLELTLQRYKRD